jgi:hypothetical protein
MVQDIKRNSTLNTYEAVLEVFECEVGRLVERKASRGEVEREIAVAARPCGTIGGSLGNRISVILNHGL